MNQETQASSLEPKIEVIQIDSNSDNNDPSMCSSKCKIMKCPLCHIDHLLEDYQDMAIRAQMDPRGPLLNSEGVEELHNKLQE